MSGSGRERRQRGGPFKRPVDGGPADAEQGGDLGDVVVAAVVHAADLAVRRGPEGGWNETDGGRRSMLLDIATEELSHLEMVAQTLSLLLKGSPSELVDQVEGNYLGELLDGNMPGYMAMAVNSGPNVLGGGGPRLTDSMGAPWTAAYIDTIGQPVADLQSDIAAEVRAKIVYERLIKQCDDAGCKDTLNFLMTREVAHQKMFQAAPGRDHR
jgi:Mn-containing catalase